jgi:sodium-independent sulfate anion transporter 11
LTCLFLLYAIRFTCGQLAKRFPTRAKLFFFINTLRTVFVILLYILFSYLANREHKANGTKPIITTLGTVPRGKMLLNLDQIHYLQLQDSNTLAYPRSQFP